VDLKNKKIKNKKIKKERKKEKKRKSISIENTEVDRLKEAYVDENGFSNFRVVRSKWKRVKRAVTVESA
jgi:hypothetical protein